MRVVFLTYGGERVPSSRTRVFQFLPHLAKAGIAHELFRVHTDLALRLWSAWSPRTRAGKTGFRLAERAIHVLDGAFGVMQNVRFAAAVRSADLVVIQKILPYPFVVALLEKSRAPIVFDIDDAIFLGLRPEQRARWDRLWRLVRLGTVENDFNTQIFGSATRVLKMVGPIDCDRYRPATKHDERVVLGWIGSNTTTVFLEQLEAPIRQLLDEFPTLEFHAIGASRLRWSHERIKLLRWTLDGEVALLRRFSVGLMPLRDEPWALGKGGYKILQYMALGIPSVVTPLGVNAELVVDGETGLFARTPDDWYRNLRRLVQDESARRAMGARARTIAEQTYSFEAYTPGLVAELRRLTEA